MIERAPEGHPGEARCGDDLTPEKIKAFEEAQANLSGALSRLMVTIERYPDLKAVAALP